MNARTSLSLRRAVAILLGLSLAIAADAEDVDPFNDGSQYLYAENAGWINAEPAGDGGPGLSVTDSFVSGWLWSENVGWISLSCSNTNSCAQVPFGVRVNSLDQSQQLLELEGYGWSENAGWISFSCANTDSCATAPYRAQLGAQTGVLNGFAWSENLGWISFSCATTGSCGNVNFGLVLTQGLASDALLADGFED
jgi:hypothetical protein